eukprot:7852938-Pyramimonas_sp.AAC.1
MHRLVDRLREVPTALAKAQIGPPLEGPHGLVVSWILVYLPGVYAGCVFDDGDGSWATILGRCLQFYHGRMCRPSQTTFDTTTPTYEYPDTRGGVSHPATVARAGYNLTCS